MNNTIYGLGLIISLGGCANTISPAQIPEPLKVVSSVPEVEEEQKVPWAQPCTKTTTKYGEYKAVLNTEGDDFKEVIYEINKFGDCTVYLEKEERTLVSDEDCNNQVKKVISYDLHKEFRLDDLRKWNLEQPLNLILSESSQYACEENLIKPKEITEFEEILQQYR